MMGAMPNLLRAGWGFGERGRRHVNPWLIHVNVWQKQLKYCKVISLQLIKINEKKKKRQKKKKRVSQDGLRSLLQGQPPSQVGGVSVYQIEF